MNLHTPQEARVAQTGAPQTMAHDKSPTPDASASPSPRLGGCACGARWSAARLAHCGGGCHLSFSSDGTFDMHRRDGACIDPATATKKDGTPRFQARTSKSGMTIWGQPGTWRPEEAS